MTLFSLLKDLPAQQVYSPSPHSIPKIKGKIGDDTSLLFFLILLDIFEKVQSKRDIWVIVWWTWHATSLLLGILKK